MMMVIGGMVGVISLGVGMHWGAGLARSAGLTFTYPCYATSTSTQHTNAAFQVTTGGKSWFIKAQEEDREEVLTNWVSAIRGAIARCVRTCGWMNAAHVYVCVCVCTTHVHSIHRPTNGFPS